MELNQLLKFAVDNNASDLHLQAGAPPMLRIGGTMRFATIPALDNEQLRNIITSLLPERMRSRIDEAIISGLDFSHAAPDLARFRCSAYSQLGRFGLVMRVIRTKIPSLEELNLPKVIRDIALSERGLILVTGTTGSGKSTTLAAMIDLINDNYRNKIIAIEDPVEFLHANKKSMVSQLELGSDTPSFEQALRQALRQDPDVILVGEMRDVDTLRIALRAADTGHQVLSTVHSANAAQTIQRIIAMFPTAETDLLLGQLSTSIEAIISQRFVTTVDGQRRPAVEILRGSPVTEKFIMQKKLTELAEYINEGESGMQSFDNHLLSMYRQQIISGTEAMRAATHPEQLAMALRGIKRIGSGGNA